MVVDFVKSASSRPDENLSRRYLDLGYKGTHDKSPKGFGHKAWVYDRTAEPRDVG